MKKKIWHFIALFVSISLQLKYLKKCWIERILPTQFGGLESVITGLCDEYPRVLRAHRGTFIGMLIVIIYMCSLPTTTYVSDQWVSDQSPLHTRRSYSWDDVSVVPCYVDSNEPLTNTPHLFGKTTTTSTTTKTRAAIMLYIFLNPMALLCHYYSSFWLRL